MKFSHLKNSSLFSLVSAFTAKPSFVYVPSITLILSLILYPTLAHAGFFSFVSNFSVNQVSADVASSSSATSENLQNMHILSAAVNPDPILDQTYSSDSIVSSGDALAPEIGPAGTVSDVDKQVNTQISTYVIHDGDTLSSVAKIFNVSINTIVWANNLNRNSVLISGQTLVILPISGIRYTIKKGDTLKSIVATYNADLNEVLQYNDISLSSVLNPGDIIMIPDAELGGYSNSTTGTSVTTPKTVKWNGKGIPPRAIWGRTNPVHDANGPSYPGYYIRPIDSGYESQGLHGYNAVDLAAPVGTPIHASAAGTVIIAITGGWNGGYGNYVVISHPNGTQTVYGHASRVLVAPGQHVEQGQLIALLGKSGEATGPHVHFEIRGAHNPF
jgi:murein DD-endopeptidase MepM/ murein hydrolase activator NlpD